MNLSLALTLVMNGLAMGMVYALMVMGLVLLIRAVGVLNFAQGDILSAGAFIGCSMLIDFNLPLWLAAIVSLVLYLLIGLIFMATVYWPVRKSSYRAAIMISTMGASVAIREVLMLIWGSDPLTMPAVFQGSSGNGRSALLTIGDAQISVQYFVVFVVGVIAILLTFTLFEKIYAGRIMEAASQNQFAARLIGIPVFITIAATYMISFALACSAGFLAGPLFNVSVSLSSMQLYAFAGLVIGGMGSIQGAIIGALLVGVLESFATVFVYSYAPAVVFGVLVLFLLFKPDGLFKSKIGVKV